MSEESTRPRGRDEVSKRLKAASEKGSEKRRKGPPYGPYLDRQGTRLYAYIRDIDPKTGKLTSIYLGPRGDAYSQGPIKVEIPQDLLEELTHAFWYAKQNRWARIREPLGRLLRKAGAQLLTDEVIK